jgi:hypothetical protein
VGAGVVPDDVLANEFEPNVDGLARGTDEGRVVAAAGAMVVDASPGRVEDGFTTVPSLAPGDPVEVPVERDALEVAAFGFVTGGCVVGGEGRGITVATPGRFVSL